MRQGTEELLAALKVFAAGEMNALRGSELAGKFNLPNKIVSNAPNRLIITGK